MKNKIKKTKTIVFEGLDGSGKTTLINRLEHYYAKQNIKVIKATGMCEPVRTLFLTNHLEPFSRYLLAFASAFEEQHNIIKPHLNQANTIIFIDRFIASNFAYQNYARQIDNNHELFNSIHSKYFINSDLLIYLDVNPKVGITRKNMQNNHLDVIEQESLDYHQRVRSGFFQYLALNNQQLSLILSATDTIESNFYKIIKKIEEINQ